MEDCIFCKLIAKKIPSNVVYEDSDTLSFMDITPSAPGHVMVVLKKHGLSILDYNKEELGTLMETVQKVARKLQAALSCQSMTIGINHLERRGAPHLHVHLIPRWEDDKGGAIQSVVNNKPKEKLEVLAEKIRNSNG